MKKLRCLFILLLLFVFSFSIAQKNVAAVNYKFESFNLNKSTSIRAIAAVDDSTCWFAGSKGVFGFTEDGGKNWHVDSLKIDTLTPEFRAMAVLDKQTVLLLCIGSPAYILKTKDKGLTWQRVYTNTNASVFFDAMKFRDKQNGIAVGDPIDSCFTIIKTMDAGETWKQINCKNIPTAFADEACFASSNSNIDFINKKVWIATGGSHSRVLFSADAGDNWKIFESPVTSGKQMTGIYSLDFYDENIGIIAGGNYDEKQNSTNNKAITTDGGKTWKTMLNQNMNDKVPGFISCIQYKPKHKPTPTSTSKNKTVIASCLPGIFISVDNGSKWENINVDDSFYTFQFSPSGNSAWFAGAKCKLGKLDLSK